MTHAVNRAPYSIYILETVNRAMYNATDRRQSQAHARDLS